VTLAILLAIVILAGGGLLLLLMRRWLKPQWSAWATLVILLAALAPLLWLREGAFQVTLASWIPIGGWVNKVVYRFDDLSRTFALLAALPALLMAAWMGLGTPIKEGHFSPWLLLLLATFLHLLCSANLLLAYASWELLILGTYLLLVFRRKALPTAGIAEWFLGIQHIAGYALMVALLLLGRSVNTLHYGEIGPGSITPTILLLLLVTAWVRMAQVPFQLWSAAAAETPGPVSTLLLGGWGLLAGPYLWVRFLSRAVDVASVAPPSLYSTIAMVAGSISLVVGAALALRQESGRRVLAGDTVSRLGLLWIALGLGTSIGLTAGLFLMLDFVLSKVVFHAAFSPGGWPSLPGRQVLFALGSWGAAGLPLSAGFVGRWLLVLGLLAADVPAYLPVVFLSVPLALSYLWRAWTLLPQDDSVDYALSAWTGPILVGLASFLPILGAVAPWLWHRILEQTIITIIGGDAIALRALVDSFGRWALPWAVLYLVVFAGGSLGMGLLSRRRTGPQPLQQESVRGVLQEPLSLLARESSWLVWIGRPMLIYRFWGQLADRAAGGMQRLVSFLERHITYFLLVTLILAGVILIVLTR
jgi:formate hydrogenlyase subunit 3/multisubunit Na+/H+ antiporter MnhD subunit